MWVYRNANNEDVNQPINGGWAGIAAGKADAYLAAAVPLIAANFTTEHPYLFSFNHEQAMSGNTQCGVGCNGTAADYRAAFIHIVDFFRNAGVADRMRFVLTGILGQYTNDNTTTGISAMDPGPAYVDIYGVDSYTRANSDGTLTKPHPELNVVSAYAASKGRPYLVGEWGVASTAAGARSWRKRWRRSRARACSAPDPASPSSPTPHPSTTRPISTPCARRWWATRNSSGWAARRSRTRLRGPISGLAAEGSISRALGAGQGPTR